jgi:hypothetical protein
LNQSEIMNVIDSNNLERDAGGKPVATFPHPALELQCNGREYPPSESSLLIATGSSVGKSALRERPASANALRRRPKLSAACLPEGGLLSPLWGEVGSGGLWCASYVTPL